MKSPMKRNVTIAIEMVTVLVACFGLTGGCGTGSSQQNELDVQTFRLEYLQPEAARRLVDPYIFGNRGGTISIDETTRTITVRETPEMLARIDEILAQYDKPEPSVSLHFQLIEANGVAPANDELLDIREALPEGVFRFSNYRQIGEAVMTSLEWNEVRQRVSGKSDQYLIEGQVGEVSVAEDGGTVQLQVGLFSTEYGEIFKTTVNARVGQLLVLGSAQPQADQGALILAVRAELVQP